MKKGTLILILLAAFTQLKAQTPIKPQNFDLLKPLPKDLFSAPLLKPQLKQNLPFNLEDSLNKANIYALINRGNNMICYSNMPVAKLPYISNMPIKALGSVDQFPILTKHVEIIKPNEAEVKVLP